MSEGGLSMTEREQALENAHPGPVIDGRPTICAFFSPRTLLLSPFLADLVSLINAAYGKSSHLGHEPLDYQRLSGTEQLISELPSQARLLVVLFSEPQNGDEFGSGLIGTGTSYPMATYDDDEMRRATANMNPVDANFFRLDHGAKPIPGIRTSGLTFMAVAPTSSRRGVASAILKMLEQDIQEQSQSEQERCPAESTCVPTSASHEMDSSTTTGTKQDRNRIRIATRAELNEAFYTKRGFEAKERIQILAGAEGIGGRTSFHVVAMEKVLS